jgi:hypothetical protein
MLYDTKYIWLHITKPIPSIVAIVQHVCQVTLSTSLQTHTRISRLYTIPSIVGGILQSVLNLMQCVKVLRYLINNLEDLLERRMLRRVQLAQTGFKARSTEVKQYKSTVASGVRDTGQVFSFSYSQTLRLS